MRYDFIEIGTSDFDTLLENAGNQVGLSVEPIKTYLDRLPDLPNVTKVNKAVKARNRDDWCEVYYVPESVIAEYRLPMFLKGCNSINSYHLQHSQLRIEHLVTKERVPQISIGDLFREYDVECVELLKIDTEGNDCYILDDLYNEITCLRVTKPNTIVFESNELSNPVQVQETVDKFCGIGYKVIHRGSDTTLSLV